MADEISTLLNQAKSEARMENLLKFLGKNARVMIYIAVAFLAIGLVALVYSIYQKNNEEKYSAIFHQSLIYQQLGDAQKAKAELEKIVNSSAPSGVKSLASLRYAAFLLEERKLNEVKTIYADVNNCTFCDAYVKDLAGLLLVRVMISDEVEVANSAALIGKIIKIRDNSKHLKNYVSEQLAMIYLFTNDLENSYKTFKVITEDKNAPQALKSRSEDGMKIAMEKGFKPQK